MGNTTGSWYVVFTKPRQEARAQEQLERQGFEIYAPRYPRLKPGSMTASIEPMFPRYLFLRPTHLEQSLAVVRSTLGVSNLVRFGLDPARVRAEVVEKIRALEAEQMAQPLASQYPYQAGDRVRIEAGPLQGLEGLVEAVAEKRVMVLMSFLGRESSVTIAPEHLCAA